jgi:hypothetical protein
MDRREDQSGDRDLGQTDPGNGEPDPGTGGHSEAANEAPDGVKRPSWEYKNDFGINVKMKEMLKATLVASESELDRLRKKLNKLQYGG